MNKIERAHQMYREGKYEEALEFYTDALSLAKTKPQKIALHSNRAACFLKLLLFNKAAEECTSVLELDHKHTGALMLRAQTLVTLKEYHSALFDVNRLIELNPSSEVYQNLHARLKTQLVISHPYEVLCMFYLFSHFSLHGNMEFVLVTDSSYHISKRDHKILRIEKEIDGVLHHFKR